MSIRPYTPQYTAVYPRVYGRITGMGGQVYGRILAVYGRMLGVYGRIPWVSGRILKVYGPIARPWHRVGERCACYTCAVTSLVQTPLPANMQKRVYVIEECCEETEKVDDQRKIQREEPQGCPRWTKRNSQEKPKTGCVCCRGCTHLCALCGELRDRPTSSARHECPHQSWCQKKWA